MSTRKIIRFAYYILAGVIMSSTACNRATVTSEAEDVAVVITPVTVTTVTYKSITETIDLPAVTAFINKNIVRAAIAGTVESISIVVGDNVKKDQILYTIRTRESAALNNSLKGDTALSFNGRINITASKDGVISSVSHQNGDFVQEGDELAVITEQNSLVFILDTPYEFVKYVDNNKTCTIHLPDNQIINGSITGKLPEMDTQAQTVRYVIRPLSGGRLPANLNAVVRLVKSSRGKASVLPKPAVLGNETQTEFWVMKLINDTTAIRVSITKGFENSEEVEILKPEFLQSDRIIITGNYGLTDTARVVIK
jgi:biotin carboxyl carrier protein